MDNQSKGIGDYLIFFLLSGAWSLYTFGFSIEALLVAWGIVTGSIVLLLIIADLSEKFKGSKSLCRLGVHKWEDRTSTYKHTRGGKSYHEGQKCSRCGKARF